MGNYSKLGAQLTGSHSVRRKLPITLKGDTDLQLVILVVKAMQERKTGLGFALCIILQGKTQIRKNSFSSVLEFEKLS